MQKKIIALAVAALASSAAFAQSNVTIYGVADAYVMSQKTDQATRTNQVNSGGLAASRIGFKGVEDLGNGLKALFALEYRVDIDQNQGVGSIVGGGGNPIAGQNLAASSGPARQQLVGLTGGFGTAVAGRLQTTGYDWAVKYDVLAGTAFSPLQNVNSVSTSNVVNQALSPVGPSLNRGMLIGGTTIAARADNAVAYISPSFGGVTVAYNHAEVFEQGITSQANGYLNNNTIGGDNAHADLVGVYYDNGPLSVGGVYAKLKADFMTGNGNANKTSDWALGASYDLKVAKLGATYQRSKTDGNGANGVATNADTAWSLGVVVPVSAAGNVIASYAKNNIKSTVAADNTKSWSLAYTHGLSKRTTAYIGYNAINRDSGAGVRVVNDSGTGTFTTVNGADTGTFLAGINHKF